MFIFHSLLIYVCSWSIPLTFPPARRPIKSSSLFPLLLHHTLLAILIANPIFILPSPSMGWYIEINEFVCLCVRVMNI